MRGRIGVREAGEDSSVRDSGISISQREGQRARDDTSGKTGFVSVGVHEIQGPFTSGFKMTGSQWRQESTVAEQLSRSELEGFVSRTWEQVALLVGADALRRELVGNIVSYVVNRNINFTNICFVGCKFCAFSRGPRE